MLLECQMYVECKNAKLAMLCTEMRISRESHPIVCFICHHHLQCVWMKSSRSSSYLFTFYCITQQDFIAKVRAYPKINLFVIERKEILLLNEHLYVKVIWCYSNTVSFLEEMLNVMLACVL